MAILSRYGCRVSLRSQLVAIAKYEFEIKPLTAIHSISSGVPKEQKEFWESLSVGELYTLYVAICGTIEKVLEILEEPICENECQSCIFGYLQQFVGDLEHDEIHHFLCFTTGSSVLIGSKISVNLNTLSELPDVL